MFIELNLFEKRTIYKRKLETRSTVKIAAAPEVRIFQ